MSNEASTNPKAKTTSKPSPNRPTIASTAAPGRLAAPTTPTAKPVVCVGGSLEAVQVDNKRLITRASIEKFRGVEAAATPAS
jgi:hypothetical protein